MTKKFIKLSENINIDINQIVTTDWYMSGKDIKVYFLNKTHIIITRTQFSILKKELLKSEES